MPKFSVTYSIVTPESAEEGETAEGGHIDRNLSLRDAVDLVRETRTSECGGVEWIGANDSDIGAARWITIHNGMEFRTGAAESRSLHFPDSLTRSSRIRIARILGVRGA